MAECLNELAGMRALTLTQPWASLVAMGAKTLETRSWATHYRGPLLIHAARGFPRWARECCEESPFAPALRHAGLDAARLPLGVLLACGDLVGCRPTTSVVVRAALGRLPREEAFGDFTPGRFAWQLANVVPLAAPIPARGALGLWTYQPSSEGVAP